MEERFDEVANRFTAMDSKMEGKFSALEGKFSALDSKMETLLGLLAPKNVADSGPPKKVPQDTPIFEALTPPNASKKAGQSQDESPSLSHPVEIPQRDYFSTPIITDDREKARYNPANFLHF
jgi:hypothetical protein